MISRVIREYEDRFKYIERQFGMIQTSYFSQEDLFEHLKQDIEQSFKILEEENSQTQRQKKYLQRRQSELSQDSQFTKVYYLKEIKVPSSYEKQKHDQQHSNRDYEHGSRQNEQLSIKGEQKKNLCLCPNRKIQIAFNFLKIEPRISNQSALIFPKNFSIHINHVDNHLKTNLHYDEINGLYQTGTIINKFNIFQRNQLVEDNKIQRKSSKKLTLQYVFRHENIDTYRTLFEDESNQNIILSITDSDDPSNIVIALAKMNFIEAVSGKTDYYPNLEKGDKLISRSHDVTLFFRKLLSFNEVCPIEQLPLMCRISLKLQVKQEILCPPRSQLDYFIGPQANPKNKRQASKSPKKIIGKTPPKDFKVIEKNQYERTKSPHHKKSYIKKLIQQGEIEEKQYEFEKKKSLDYIKSSPGSYQHLKKGLEQKNNFKHQKVTIIDQRTIFLHLRDFSSMNNSTEAAVIDGKYFDDIKDSITPEYIQVEKYHNVHIAKAKLSPVVQFRQENRQNQDSDYYFKSSYPAPFSIKIKINFDLKDKSQGGNVHIKLPFIQKLNQKLVIKNKSPLPTYFQVFIKPNTIFCFGDENEMNISSKSSQQSKRKEQVNTVKNKLIRLQNNLYAFSEAFSHIHFQRNPILPNIQSECIFIYNFKLSKRISPKETPSFFIYPFGTVAKVIKGHSEQNFLIYFKISFQDLLNENVRQITSEDITERNKFSNSKNFVFIEMAISCKFPFTQSSKFQAEVQFFQAKLVADSAQVSSSPYKQIQVKSQDNFCSISMRGLIKEEQKVNISSKEKRVMNVVNGQNFKLSNECEDLQIQLLKPIQPGHYLKTYLIIDNWQTGKTSFVQIKLINRQKQKNQQAEKTENEEFQRVTNKKSEYFFTLESQRIQR